MAKYTEASLHLITDTIATLRRLLSQDPQFISRLSASYLAGELARLLVWTGAVPVRIDVVDGWWIIRSDKDWLAQTDGSVSLWYFHHIVWFPEAGREACRSEALLTAFADVVVTRGATDEVTWITGDGSRWVLPNEILDQFTQLKSGRIVAFRYSGDKARVSGDARPE